MPCRRRRSSPTRSTPNHAPGPSTYDLEREKRAREDLKEAKRMSDVRAKEAERKLEEIEEINRKKEEDRKNYPLPDYLKEHMKSGKVNIAVTGNSGVGKSAFINFMRGLKSSDVGFAKTGISECTMKPTFYQLNPSDSSDEDEVGDLPGVGTIKFPKETYMQQMGIRYYDAVLILTGDRFTEAEAMLKQEMDEKRVPHFCVRTKADTAWMSKVNQEEEDQDGEELTAERKQEVKNETIKEIKGYFMETYSIDIYVIASIAKYKKDFEFDKLKANLEVAIKEARCDRNCPCCLEMYSDYGGSAGKGKVQENGNMVCEKCFDKWLGAWD